MDFSSPPSPADQKNRIDPRSPLSLPRTRARRWRHGRARTAVVVVVALFLSTSAWLSLIFSATSARCFHRFTNWQGRPHTTSLTNRPRSTPTIATTSSVSSSDRRPRRNHHPSTVSSQPQPQPPPPRSTPLRSSLQLGRNRNRSLSESEDKHWGEEPLGLKQIVFGIAGSSQLWRQRKEFVGLWWRPTHMRGHVWLEEQVSPEDWDASLPPIMISEDTSRFRYTNPTGHPSGLRISRIISESFRLGLPQVRWFVLGDDDTIFNVDNLVAVLSKYDPAQMVYIGGPSESHSANTYFSGSMAYGGGGIAISYPLAEALSNILDDCLDRYHKLYGSDDRLHACISELGIPLSREHGFHQWDIRGDAHGLLSSHPIAPFVSIHHVEAVHPFYQGLSHLDSLKLFTEAMKADPMSFLQQSICYDRKHRLSFSISLGYAIQVFPNILLPRTLARSENTYSAWNGINHRNEFDLDTRDPLRSLCERPILFFLKGVKKQGKSTWGSYARARQKDDLKRRLYCFPRSPPLPHVENIQVSGFPLSKNWHLAPRRLCCKLKQTSDEFLAMSVGQCDKGSFGSFIDSV